MNGILWSSFLLLINVEYYISTITKGREPCAASCGVKQAFVCLIPSTPRVLFSSRAFFQILPWCSFGCVYRCMYWYVVWRAYNVLLRITQYTTHAHENPQLLLVRIGHIDTFPRKKAIKTYIRVESCASVDISAKSWKMSNSICLNRVTLLPSSRWRLVGKQRELLIRA